MFQTEIVNKYAEQVNTSTRHLHGNRIRRRDWSWKNWTDGNAKSLNISFYGEVLCTCNQDTARCLSEGRSKAPPIFFIICFHRTPSHADSSTLLLWCPPVSLLLKIFFLMYTLSKQVFCYLVIDTPESFHIKVILFFSNYIKFSL